MFRFHLFFLVAYFAYRYRINASNTASFRRDYTLYSEVKTFYKLHLDPKPWNEARKICIEEGATLAAPRTAAEAEVYIKVMKNIEFSTDFVYLGIQAFSKGIFAALDGTLIDDMYQSWAPGEPNDDHGCEDCVAIDRRGKLNDLNCEKQFPFICEKSQDGVKLNGDYQVAETVKSNKPFFRSDYAYEPSQKSFYKMHLATKSWLEARALCEAEGAFLVTPESTTEREILVKIMDEKLPKNIVGTHIGIHDIYVEGIYLTLDGRNVPLTPDYWAPGEPTNANDQEDCVQILRSGKYDDIDCSLKSPFICKKTLDTLTSNPSCGTSDLAYFPNEKTGSCYKVHLTPKTWSEAFAICYAEQSYLAIINSADEAEFFKSQLERYPPESLPGDFFKDGIFLGFHDMFTEGNFVTIHGTPLSETGYVQWSPTQPDNAGNNENCGHIFRSGLLNDITCSWRLIFFCERDIGNAKENQP